MARIKLHSLLVMVLSLGGVTGFLVKQTKGKMQVRVVWGQFLCFFQAGSGVVQSSLGNSVESLEHQRRGRVGGDVRIQVG